MLADLTCDKLGDVSEGEARKAIDRSLAVAIQDAYMRGHDRQPRTVTIKVTMVPQVRSDGDVVGLSMDVRAQPSLPMYRTTPTVAKVECDETGTVTAKFHPESKDNPDQRSLFPDEKPA